MSLVGKDEVESLDRLKAAANTDLAELQTTHGDLQNKLKDLETDLDIKKSLLNTVLLEKDAISTKLSQAKDQLLDKEQDLSEMRATIATFRGSSDGRDAALELRVQKLQEKVEKRRIALNNSTEVSCIVSFIDYIASPNFKQHVKKQNAIIRDLKEQLDAAMTADTNEKLASMEERLTELKVPRPPPSSSSSITSSTLTAESFTSINHISSNLTSASSLSSSTPTPAPAATIIPSSNSIIARPSQSAIITSLLTFLAYRAEKEGIRDRSVGTREFTTRYSFS